MLTFDAFTCIFSQKTLHINYNYKKKKLIRSFIQKENI